jgi:alkylation response protein AidB-like acyl-CoA dehydrogenase
MVMHFSFPTLELTSDHSALRMEVRGFLEEQRKKGVFTPVSSGWMVFNRELSLACGAQGYIGLAWPKAYGGAEKTQVERYVVVEEMLAAGAPVGAHWVADRQSGPQILKHGCDTLRRDLLPRMARGEVCFAIGMSEPDSGSDLASIRSSAVRDGNGWRLNGRKIWTTNGHRADYMIGLFRTEPRLKNARHQGMTQFVVDLTSSGVSRTPIEDLTGGEDFSEVTFDDVFVPDSHVLGEPGSGWKLVMGELAYERSGPERFLSVFSLLHRAVEVKANSVGGGDAEKLGRLITHVAILRQMSMSIAGRIAAGDLPVLEAALVKDMGNNHEQEVSETLRSLDDLVPAFGGDGLGGDLAAAILAAPSFTLRGGTPEVLRGIIARGLGLR